MSPVLGLPSSPVSFPLFLLSTFLHSQTFTYMCAPSWREDSGFTSRPGVPTMRLCQEHRKVPAAWGSVLQDRCWLSFGVSQFKPVREVVWTVVFPRSGSKYRGQQGGQGQESGGFVLLLRGQYHLDVHLCQSWLALCATSQLLPEDVLVPLASLPRPSPPHPLPCIP